MKKKLICTVIIVIGIIFLSLVNRDYRIKKAKEEPVLFGQTLPFWARNLEPNDCVYWGLTNCLKVQIQRKEKYIYFSDKFGSELVLFRRSDGEWVLVKSDKDKCIY